MLRITLPTVGGSGVFVLEGRLVGLWVEELLRVARGADQASGSIFDLQDVFYVDTPGEEALRKLSELGARFITDSAYGKDLCKRLNLKRVTALEMEGGPDPTLTNGRVSAPATIEDGRRRKPRANSAA